VPVLVVSEVVVPVVGVVVPVLGVVVPVVGVVAVEVVVLVAVVGVLTVGVVGVLTGQERWASAETVAAASEIALARRASTPERLLAELASVLAALLALAQSCAARAAETEFS
jgi:uncharacterized protein HemX